MTSQAGSPGFLKAGARLTRVAAQRARAGGGSRGGSPIRTGSLPFRPACSGLAGILARLRHFARLGDAANFFSGRRTRKFFDSLFCTHSLGRRASGIRMLIGFTAHLQLKRVACEFRRAGASSFNFLTARELLVDALNRFEQQLRLCRRAGIVLRRPGPCGSAFPRSSRCWRAAMSLARLWACRSRCSKAFSSSLVCRSISGVPVAATIASSEAFNNRASDSVMALMRKPFKLWISTRGKRKRF